MRHGDGHSAEPPRRPALPRILVPGLQPGAARDGALLGASRLAGQTLIHHRTPELWIDWFRGCGHEPPPEVRHGPVYNEMSLAIDAAVAGQGVALARSALAALDLEAGRLVRPVAETAPALFAYWIVCDPASADLPKVARFRSWLLRQAGGEPAE